MKPEEWRDIKGYEGYYQVSSWGRVRSVDRWRVKTNGVKYYFKGKILKPIFNRGPECKYLSVCLSICQKRKTFCIHRLVITHFIPNPDPIKYTQCNHIDENIYNNNVENLEWCTPKENVNYGTRTERACAPLKKRVRMLTIDGDIVNEFESTCEASRVTGIYQAGISRCCLKKPHVLTAGGYRWEYVQPAQ